MITKKICMVGAFAVGKTALLKRFVSSIFSDDYLSTVGVKISKKTLATNQGPLNLMLWDLEGRDAYGEVNLGYLRGANGFILVADGTRKSTLGDALSLKQKVFDLLGEIPYLIIINKDDIKEHWEISKQDMHALREQGHTLITTSAKTGNNVDSAFTELSGKLLAKS